jgi:hypothetical protein
MNDQMNNGNKKVLLENVLLGLPPQKPSLCGFNSKTCKDNFEGSENALQLN